jgi:hypothetical protein
MVWGGVGLTVFCVFWPWIWLDPWAHLMEYFRQTADRATIYVQLHGSRYTDRTVPRWFAPATFFAAIPFKVVILAAIGCQKRVLWFGTSRGPDVPAPPRTSRETWLLLASVTPLLVFSLPGVPVYDGERLFMTVFPIWTVLAGRGCSMLWSRLQSFRPNWAPSLRVIIVSLMLLQAISLYRLMPCYLSYYNVFTLGLSGAASQGEELDYWGTAITRTLLEETTRVLPPGSVVAVAPVLHQFQLPEMRSQSPILRRHGLQLVAYGPQRQPAEYVLLFCRQADLPPELKELVATTNPVAAVRRRGVVLGGLYRLPSSVARNR